MFGIINIFEFVLGAIAIILLPGPNSMYVLVTAAQKGVKKGYSAAIGVFLGDAILIILSVLGATTLLKALPFLFVTIKSIGALYLGFLGLKMLWGTYQIWLKHKMLSVDEIIDATTHLDESENDMEVAEVLIENDQLDEVKSEVSPFIKALFISLINPKAILFFLSFFIQFVAADAPHPFIAFFLLGLILQCISFSYLSALIFSGSRLTAAFNARPLWMIVGTASVGLLFIGFGIRLALANLS